jgi:hypothetical protein
MERNFQATVLCRLEVVLVEEYAGIPTAQHRSGHPE